MKYVLLLVTAILFFPLNVLSAEYSDYTFEQWQEHFFGYGVNGFQRDENNAVWILGRLTHKGTPTITRYDESGFTTWLLGMQPQQIQRMQFDDPDHIHFVIDQEKEQYIDYRFVGGRWTVDDGDDSWSTDSPPNNGIIEQAGFTIPLASGNEWVYERDFYFKWEPTSLEHHDRVIDTAVRWKQSEDGITYQLLGGATYTQNSDGTINGLEFRPCGEVECSDNGYYQLGFLYYRGQRTVTVPAGTFDVFTFSHGAVHGSSRALASGVGQVSYYWVTDIPDIEKEEWKLESANINGKELFVEEQEIPRVIETHIFPNPFNPATTIVFTLPKTNHTRLTIYNFVGQKVKTLVDAPVSAGTHQIVFDGSNLPSGMYFYSIESGEYVSSGRMVLVK